MERNLTTETQRHGEKGNTSPPDGASVNVSAQKRRLIFFTFLSLSLYVSVVNLSCSSRPADLRSVIPSDALVYLETNDLGKAVAAITGNKKFREAATKSPDLSAINGVKLAVAVTGFETTEQQITDENSILNFRPRFVAVAETNAWSWQANAFAENKLGEFINDIYGGEVVLETSAKHDGKYYVWTARDGRRAYALVQGSVIFFGNDESAIEKCLAVKRGETESIAKNPKVTDGERLAFGYVSPDGVAQIANIAGISLAMNASEESEVKSFISRVLPEILRNSMQEATWTATKNEQGIEDRLTIGLNPEIAAVFNETLAPASGPPENLTDFLPSNAVSVTRYDLKNPQIAWRSVLLTAQKQTDAVSGNLILAFSGSLFEPYGIEDAEIFLNSIGSRIVTSKFDDYGENVVVIASGGDKKKLQSAISKEINFGKAAETYSGAEIWKSDNGETAAAFIGNILVLGHTENVLQCLDAKQSIANHEFFKSFSESNAVAVTIATDNAATIVNALGGVKAGNIPVTTSYLTETRFNQNGIERRTISDFGLIGSIIDLLSEPPA